jgi:hypothetical protein
MKEGYGIFNYSDGRMFEGLWFNGVQSGFGVYTEINGLIYLGVWVEGNMVFSFLME